MNTPPTLDRFETALLQELRTHVASRPALTAPAPEAPRPRRRRRWAAGVAVAAAAATAYVVVSPGGPAVSPAYGISETPDGDVVVTVHRLEDAAGLEAALREHGIDAEVSFDPESQVDGELNHQVPDGDIPPPEKEAERGTVERDDTGESGPRLDQAEPAEGGELTEPDPAGCGTGEPATLRQQDDDWVLRIPADSPLQDRPIQLATNPDGNLMVQYPGDEPDSLCAVESVG